MKQSLSLNAVVVSTAAPLAFSFDASRAQKLRGAHQSAQAVNKQAPNANNGRDLRFEFDDYHDIGCFRAQNASRERSVDSIQQCAGFCSFNRFFALVPLENDTTSCRCFSDAPETRLSFDNCDDFPEGMEVYFYEMTDDTCDSENSRQVRDYLVQENDIPFGLDLVTSMTKDSPFVLFKQNCGTNMYEVQNEVTEGNVELKTSSESVVSYAKRVCEERMWSVSVSAEATFAKFIKLGSISYSMDVEETKVLESSSAQESQSEIFDSVGVKTIAEVKIIDFENKKHFVTLSPQFTSLLKNYLQSGFSRRFANQLMDSYGHVIVERGLYGGYARFRSVMSKFGASDQFSSEEDKKSCYEGSISAQAAIKGFTVSGSASGSYCGQDVQNILRSERNKFASEASELVIVGGYEDNGTFEVTAQTATFLPSNDLYRDSSTLGGGIRYRLISDFLDPEKVSPLTVKASLISEEQFGQIKSNLEAHILEALEEIQSEVEKCGCSGVGFIGTDGNCACLDEQFQAARQKCYKNSHCQSDLCSNQKCYGREGDMCSLDGDCQSNRCDGLCYPKLPNHSTCDEHSDCESELCSGGKCLRKVNAVCVNDVDCDSGRCEGDSNDRKCAARLLNGDSCNEPTDCLSGTCSNGKCLGLTKHGWTDYLNSFDHQMWAEFKQGNGQRAAICGVNSYHNSHHEDRRSRFKYCMPVAAVSASKTHSTSWSPYDGRSYVDCPAKSFLSLIRSHHDNHREDRQFYYECSRFEGYSYVSNSCYWTDYQNNFDGGLNFECPDQHVIAGMDSYHNSHHEDRRFKFKCCRLQN